jgi:AraC-like DNA-binding protein
LIVVVQGCIHVVFDEGEEEGRAGDLLFYPAGRWHTEASDPQEPVETFFMAFEWAAPPEMPPRILDTQGRVRLLIHWLYQEWSARAHQGLWMAFAQALLAEWQRLARRPEAPLVAGVRRLIQKRLAETLSVEDLAEAAGLSKFHFIRRFRRLTGRSPMDELRVMRVEHARQLILKGGLSLKEIAPRAGLGNVHHMAKLFRRYLNATPHEIRDGLKRPQPTSTQEDGL